MKVIKTDLDSNLDDVFDLIFGKQSNSIKKEQIDLNRNPVIW